MSVVALARSQLGVRRGKSAEDDRRIHAYLGGDPLEQTKRLDWCAAFVLWVHREAGEPLPGNFWRNRACSHLQRELEKAGWRVSARWKAGDEPLQPGDIVFFERKVDVRDDEHLIPLGAPGHVGLVARWRRTGFESIEGNISGEVRLMTRILPHQNFLAAYRHPRP